MTQHKRKEIKFGRFRIAPNFYISRVLKFGLLIQVSTDFSITARLRIFFYMFELDIPFEYILRRKLSLEERDELIAKKESNIRMEMRRARNRRRRKKDVKTTP